MFAIPAPFVLRPLMLEGLRRYNYLTGPGGEFGGRIPVLITVIGGLLTSAASQRTPPPPEYKAPPHTDKPHREGRSPVELS